MNVQEAVIPGAGRLRVAPEVSPEARRRLRWMDYYHQHGRNASQTCRHFDISRETFYRWGRRYDPRRPQSLEDDRHTRRPRRVRQPATPSAVEARLRKPDGSYGWDGAYGTYWWVNRKEQMVAVMFVQTPGRSLQYDFDNAVSQAVIE